MKKVISTYLFELQKTLKRVKVSDVINVAQVILDAYYQDRTIFIFGNGGSAATASHMACDLIKGTLIDPANKTEKRLKVISLTDNIASLTAFANDHSYKEIFLQQLKSLMKPHDVVIAITTSGNSENVVEALQYAKKHRAVTIGLLGFNGGKTKKIVDYSITIQSSIYGVIEDVHLSLQHIITSVIVSQKSSKKSLANKKN